MPVTRRVWFSDAPREDWGKGMWIDYRSRRSWLRHPILTFKWWRHPQAPRNSGWRI